MWKKAQGLEVSRHGQITGVSEIPPWDIGTVGSPRDCGQPKAESYRTTLYLLQRFQERLFLLFSLVPFPTVFLPITLEYSQHCQGWFSLSRPGLPGVDHPCQIPSRS